MTDAIFTVSPASPTAAYKAASSLGSGDPGSFATMLGQAASGVVDLGRAADRQATAALEGHGNLTEVVTALSKAELALQTTTAIRDRMVAAYQDVMKMAI